MKRLVYDEKKCSFIWKDWIPEVTFDYGASCVRKSKYVSDTVRINNNEVSTGSTRTALYTMPGGVDNGVRYAPLYDFSGLDITETEAIKNQLANAKTQAEKMIQEEFDKISTETAEKISISKNSTSKGSDSSSSQSSSSE